MNIIEIVGFATLFVGGVGVALWALGILKIDASITVTRD